MSSIDPPEMRAFKNDEGDPLFETAGTVRFPRRDIEYVYERPRTAVIAWSIDEVTDRLRQVQRAVNAGASAAGYIAYEAAPAFDASMTAHPPGAIPLLWFGIYDDVRAVPLDTSEKRGDFQLGEWQAQLTEEQYREQFEAIKQHLGAGDSYQVNFTFPLRTLYKGDPLVWFRRLCQAQPGGYPCYIDLGRYKIVSVSPELFFERGGGKLVTRPMKGTRPRGRFPEEDERMRQELASSPKDQAENVMIVDMLRNDMGRVSAFGSVKVRSLFDTEKYSTVWQLTSTIESNYAAGVPEILGALFPSPSVTGAPKIITTRIINDCEPHRRGVYCGAIGWWRKGGARFSVGIRTALMDMEKSIATYYVGSGVTWDSDASQEYNECLQKARVLNHRRGGFQLLETLRFEGGYAYLELHLKRLQQSAEYFDFEVDLTSVRKQLDRYAEALPEEPQRVRLLVDEAGLVHLEHAPLGPARRYKVGISDVVVDSSDVFLFHKTTRREIYARARESHPDCDDVLLFNERGELTEATIANVVIEYEGRRYTPARECGLLAGTFRQHLLDRGELVETILRREHLEQGEQVFLINSVREWIAASVVA